MESSSLFSSGSCKEMPSSTEVATWPPCPSYLVPISFPSRTGRTSRARIRGYSELDRCQESLDREETLRGSEWASPGEDCARETSEGQEPLERQSWLGCTAGRFLITSRLPRAADQKPSPTCFGGGGIKQPVALHFARSISGHSEGLAENPPRLASFQKSNILAML